MPKQYSILYYVIGCRGNYTDIQYTYCIHLLVGKQYTVFRYFLLYTCMDKEKKKGKGKILLFDN